MTVTVRDSTLAVTIDGGPVTYAIGADWSLSYDQAVGEATIVAVVPPGTGDYYAEATITVNGQARFTGLLMQYDRTAFPRQVSIPLRGRLWRAQQYKLPQTFTSAQDGLHLEDFVGGPATDEQIVQAVFDYIGLDLGGGSVGGTGTVMGTVAPEQFIWNQSETALDYIQRIDSISLGYRTFESAAGQIFRTQISSRPTGSVDYTFTEGVDILGNSTSSRTVQDAYNAVRVEGYDVGDYLDPRVFYIEESNPFQGGGNPNRVFSFSSMMIERRADASSGQGMSCESVANYLLGEYNREIVHVTLQTPRDDLFGPGQIHLVQGPGGAPDRLGVGEKLWVQRAAGHYDQSGAFSQTLQYIGGGA